MTRLTPEQISSLTGQALADAVAERVMGWTRDRSGWKNEGRWACSVSMFQPHIYHNDAALVMERIAELWKCNRFLAELRGIVGHGAAWSLFSASPTDRCRAALMAVEGER